MNLKVIDVPDDSWVERLRPGHFVFLVKENEYARVAWAWVPPDAGGTCGQIALHRFKIGQTQTWFMRLDGRGIDRSRLLAPCEGNVPDDPPPIEEPVS